ncbi:MAG: hypothetical protein GY827_07965 [Cytophagales bacterium]|nr:hypothetical protein [Cytophagales bacterium]
MSSHHIVKDDQEPALFIAKAHNSEDYQLISQLLEWSPVVLIEEKMFDFAEQWQIKTDIVFCSEEKAENIKEQVAHQFPIEVLALDKTKSTLENVLQKLDQRNQKAVNIFWQGFNERFLLAITHLIKDYKVTLYDTQQSAFYCPQGSWEKWLPKGGIYQVIDLDNQPIQIICDKDGIQRVEREQAFWIIEIFQ